MSKAWFDIYLVLESVVISLLVMFILMGIGALDDPVSYIQGAVSVIVPELVRIMTSRRKKEEGYVSRKT